MAGPVFGVGIFEKLGLVGLEIDIVFQLFYFIFFIGKFFLFFLLKNQALTL